MSLLMKALEKAAKDRDDARAEPDAVTADAPAAAAATPRSELTLEPLRIEPHATAPTPEPPVRHAAASRGSAAGTPSREQAQAASVLEAGSGACLSEEAGGRAFFLGELSGHQLDGDFAVEDGVAPAMEHAHAAAPDPLEKLVSTELRRHGEVVIVSAARV